MADNQSRPRDEAMDELKIGRKVSELRQKKNLTLNDLATKTGIEKNLLAEIEKGNYMPPVATLITISKTLNVGMGYFFKEQDVPEKISITRSHERMRLERRPHHQAGEVDYIYEVLETKNPDRHMEPLFVEFRPMETNEMVFNRHEGEEFLYLVEGTLEFRTNERAETLSPGDSLYFQSSVNHSFRALNDAPAKAVVVVWSER